ncbi:MAG: hypothetical protein ISR90_01285 [Candidatus Marinimicrobia bacterium]|nr:hypothetical protein [Candidatus Neomarinimicrobiota bacterium]
MKKFILAISLVLLYNCGFYSLKGSLPAHIKSISISPVVNESPEFGVSENVGEQISEMLISENVLSVTNEDVADSRLNVTIKSVLDKPYTYSAGDTYEQVEEWRITLKAKVVWYDLTKDEAFFDKTISSWGAYGTGVDISTDNIDNDGDGLVDSDDDDEFGSPRESALEVAIRKLSEDIINEITSTW